MTRMCLALDLKDDPALIAEYERYHQDVWPEILTTIRDSGIEQMEIYRTGNRLFMIMEVSARFKAEEKATADMSNEIVQQWETLMWKFQQPLAWARKDEKWVPMERIFQLAG